MTPPPEPRGRRHGALRSFVWGSVVGGAIAVVAPALRRRAATPPDDVWRTAGLRAFEGAPCWEYDHGRPAERSPGHATHGNGAPPAGDDAGERGAPDRATAPW